MRHKGRPITPTLRYERALWKQGYERVAGVDEVGRGSWAGPLVAAAVILPCQPRRCAVQLAGVCDSKELTAGERDLMLLRIRAFALSIGIGWVSHADVDSMGLARANRMALARAVHRLPVRPDALILDFFSVPELDLPQHGIARGDSLSLSIAAASIVAKVIRDRVMSRLDARFPHYGFAGHKGYGTPFHQAALEALGPSPIHRVSFRPVRERVGA